MTATTAMPLAVRTGLALSLGTRTCDFNWSKFILKPVFHLLVLTGHCGYNVHQLGTRLQLVPGPGLANILHSPLHYHTTSFRHPTLHSNTLIIICGFIQKGSTKLGQHSSFSSSSSSFSSSSPHLLSSSSSPRLASIWFSCLWQYGIALFL